MNEEIGTTIYFEDDHNIIGNFVYQIDDIERIAQHLVNGFQALRYQWINHIQGLASICLHWGDIESFDEFYTHIADVMKRVYAIEAEMMEDLD